MNINEEFKMKFNQLDQICKKLYPKYPKGFDALRQFAYSLESNNKSTLLNIIKARNINTHDDTNIISFNRDSIKFLQGLIDGANRRLHNGLDNKIDANLENLRTKNLKIMGSKFNYVISKYSFLSRSELENIKTDLFLYIEKEKRAKTLELIKKYYFDFLNFVKLIEKRPSVKRARSEKKAISLENAKTKAINDIEQMFIGVISETTLFNVLIRNNAKALKKSAITSIGRAKSFYEIETILEEYEDKFDSLDY